jgi:hypothetical protein
MTRFRPCLAALAALLACAVLPAQEPLPLPEAPLRIVIPDAAAFDAELSGEFRAFLAGAPRGGEPVTAAWRRSRVGSKLENQWLLLGRDLPWTWVQITQLRPRAVGLALLDVGHLEAVLVVDTPLAQLPLTLPKGAARTHRGAAYTLVTRGAADGSADKDRRMGLAWARLGTRLILATSERSMGLAIDAAQAGRGLRTPLQGLAAMELDLDALRKDRYFRREFPFAQGPETGLVRAALRREQGRLVEVRTGASEPRSGVYRFDGAGYAAAGWEPGGQGFWAAFRRGLLEPVPAPEDRPVPAPGPLPDAAPGPPSSYIVDFTQPRPLPGTRPGQEADLGPWRALLAQQEIPSWGFFITGDGVRRMAFPWPEAMDPDFLERCRATAGRRAGRASVVEVDGAREIRVGPGLPVLALRRAGPLLWAAPSARYLEGLPEPKLDPQLVRWARVDLGAVRAEAGRWAKVEGPEQPERVRPLSDQVLGLLGWMPAVTSIAVERRRTADGWEERVQFGDGP